MLLNSTKMMLNNVMMIGVIMTICSNNWMSMWMGLEMSMMAFIPMIQNFNQLSSESMIKYFIIQSIASTLFLFGIISMLIGVNTKNELLMLMSMLIKLGMAPFHNWMLMIIQYINYSEMFILLTVMKIAPISIMHQIQSNMMIIPIAMSMIISSISCMNQSSMRKIMAWSSIYSVSMMMISINNMSIPMTYMLVYSMMLMMILFLANKLKINYINQMVFNEYSLWIKMTVWFNMLSLGGFPPTMGFIIKVMIIQSLMTQQEFILSAILMMTSLLTMLFYIRLTFNSMLIMSTHMKWTKTSYNSINSIMVINFTLPPMIMSMNNII
uniref:NADH dehydrogenase subunit 2 n=1 Tax=Dalbulus maidis TaxID=74065 RepID=UPI0022FD4CC8|nr:NADH dehydrogenase subunit 2 [Dalbulus maidis]WAS32287.1 NADH dehydrogenase subunit 2 [Dalbulus maidis]